MMIRTAQQRKMTTLRWLPARDSYRSNRLCHIRENSTVDDIHNYLTFARFGGIGIALTGLGLIGCLMHTSHQRFAISFVVTIAGCLLVLDAAARFHRTSPSPVVSLIAVGIAGASLMLARRKRSSVKRTEPTPPD